VCGVLVKQVTMESSSSNYKTQWYCRLFGNEGGRGNPIWTITTINFTAVFDRDCVPVDYENWTMSDGVCYYYV